MEISKIVISTISIMVSSMLTPWMYNDYMILYPIVYDKTYMSLMTKQWLYIYSLATSYSVFSAVLFECIFGELLDASVFFVTRNADFGQFRNPCKWRCIAGQINYKWWILRYILDHQRVFFPAIFLQGLKQTSQFSHSANIEKYGGDSTEYLPFPEMVLKGRLTTETLWISWQKLKSVNRFFSSPTSIQQHL